MMKKIMALFIACILTACSILPAFGASGALTADTEISVKGLDTGDKVSFYRVLEFSQDAAATKGWIAAAGFEDLSEAQIKQMLSIDLEQGVTGGISADLAGIIGDMAEAATAKYPEVAENSGTAKVQNPDPGLYIALIQPGKPDTLYNPVFVGADYKENATNAFEPKVLVDSYSPASMAKKATIGVDKKATSSEADYEDGKSGTVKVGDTITFTVTTTIPEFADNYTEPVFKVTDVLSAGLELDTDSIEVYAAAEADISENNKLAEVQDYDLDPEPTTGGFTVAFTDDYILGLDAAQAITIQYEALVTHDAESSVNIMDNEVTVNFSNNPTDTTGHGVLKDITKHYTFDIDANLLGNTSYHATEIVKVGVDSEGNEITEKRTLSNAARVGALEGAEFKLYTTQACADGDEYVNEYYDADSVIVSDADGRLTVQGADTPGIRGLDAGIYYLKETKAPAGYIKAQDPVKIEIEATLEPKTYKETIDGKEVTYEADELVSYTVKINDIETATYTMTNEKPDEGDEGITTDGDAGKIKNVQGTELPATGGMGTTLFYIIGSILVIGAGIVLVAKKRMSAQ